MHRHNRVGRFPDPTELAGSQLVMALAKPKRYGESKVVCATFQNETPHNHTGSYQLQIGFAGARVKTQVTLGCEAKSSGYS